MPLADPAASYEKLIDQTSSPGITVQPAAQGGTEFLFAAARNKSVAWGMILFCIIWTGTIVFRIRLKAPVSLAIVFGLFDLLFFGFSSQC